MKEIIEKLKKKGVKFEKGLTTEEFSKIHDIYGFTFPKEIKEFLSLAVPVGKSFWNYRDFSDENIEQIKNFQNRIEDTFEFDIENNNLLEDFRKKFTNAKNDEELKKEVFDYLHTSTKLIPFFAHRCFFDGLDDMPIISYWQPTDFIFYGMNFEDYLENEFKIKKNPEQMEIPFDKLKGTGIWYDLLVMQEFI